MGIDATKLAGRLERVEIDGDLPARSSIPVIFDELDYQMACQAYLWALPLVSFAEWQAQNRELFDAPPSDLTRYASYRGSARHHYGERHDPVDPELHRSQRDGPARHRLSGGSHCWWHHRLLAA